MNYKRKILLLYYMYIYIYIHTESDVIIEKHNRNHKRLEKKKSEGNDIIFL